MSGWVDRIRHGRHAPFYLGVAAALIALPVVLFLDADFAVVGASVAFFLFYLGFTFLRLPRLDASYLRRHLAETDEPVFIIFAVTLLTIVVSLVSLFLLLNQQRTPSAAHLLLAFASVALGWLTIHTMAAMHYAHVYWRRVGELGEDVEIPGGIRFPGTAEPGGYDFLYFSLVIGMTAQTADVEIVATGMRKLNMLHAVISFFFNTVLVAAVVNAAVTLAG